MSDRFDWRWVFWLALFVLAVLSVQLLSGVLMPFLAGFVIAYLLNPVANWLVKRGLNRLGAVLLILFLFLFVLSLALVITVPLLGRQLVGFIALLPDYASTLQKLMIEQGGQLMQKYGGHWLKDLGIDIETVPSDLQKSLSDLVGQGAQALKSLLESILTGSAALINLVSLLVVTPVVAFYILLDWDSMIASVDSVVPLQSRSVVYTLARQIDAAMSGFLRGQSLVCLFLALWYGIGLTLVGLNFGFLIGMTGGLLSFIPYIGSLIVLLVATSVSIVQGWPDWNLLLLTLAVVGVGQFLEGNILSPELVGGSIGLHPVWLMFALLAFGSLFGFSGLIMAVPIAAAMGVLFRFALSRYRQSRLYLGNNESDSAILQVGCDI